MRLAGMDSRARPVTQTSDVMRERPQMDLSEKLEKEHQEPLHPVREMKVINAALLTLALTSTDGNANQAADVNDRSCS